MPKAHEIAFELRKIANALDTISDQELIAPSVRFRFWSNGEKQQFLALASVFPRPYEKTYEASETGDLSLSYQPGGPAHCTVRLTAVIPRKTVCTLVEPARPAVWKCEPVLSDAEELSMGGAK